MADPASPVGFQNGEGRVPVGLLRGAAPLFDSTGADPIRGEEEGVQRPDQLRHS
jgi:hypothetical protein